MKHVQPQKIIHQSLHSIESDTHEHSPSADVSESSLKELFQKQGRKGPRARARANFPEENVCSHSNPPGTGRELHAPFQISSHMGADRMWEKGLTGKNVKVAVFDTGLGQHPYFKNIVERINWTDESTVEDTLGHGTFVTGL